MELWNNTMRRWVKSGSKGIALIHKDGGGRPRLAHVFDVSDTCPVNGAKTPCLWELRADHHAAVAESLERQYGPTEETDIGWALMEQARRAVGGVYRDHLHDLAYDTENSLLEELDGLNLEVRFKNLLTASVQYTVLTRCGLDPSDYLEDEDLSGITEFSTPAVLHHLGDAASTVSMELLNEISAVKRESEETSIYHGRVDLHESGRLPDPRPDDGRRGRDTRSGEESGFKGYDTVRLNWNQVQKRIRSLFDSGRYLNVQEKEYLPAYEKQTLARRILPFL